MNVQINPDCCISIKNKKSNQQCKNKKRPNSEFCGVHQKARIVIKITDLYSPNHDKKIDKKSDKKSDKGEFLSESDILNCNNFNKLTITSLKTTIGKLNLWQAYGSNYTSNSKRCLFNHLFKYYSLLSHYRQNLLNIIKIQARIRGYLVRRRNKCINDEDFFTLEGKYDIPEIYFFSYVDNNGFEYCFDIRSFNKILETHPINPYTLAPIPDYAIGKFKTKILYLQSKNINFLIERDKLPPEKEFEQKVIEIFHKYDMLDNYTNHLWFMRLSHYQLKELYKRAEDIWNYRAELTSMQKCRIVKDGMAFNINLYEISKFPNHKKRELQLILLKEMDRFVTEGVDESEKKLGALLILSALTQVSPDAAEALPHLVDI